MVLITTHFSHSITIGLEAPGILEYMIFNMNCPVMQFTSELLNVKLTLAPTLHRDCVHEPFLSLPPPPHLLEGEPALVTPHSEETSGLHGSTPPEQTPPSWL